MDLELLRTFVEVNRTRHFGDAAESLHVTQAAVSARIKQLESILGVQLFDRIKRNIQLTPEGHRLLQHAEALLSGWRKARQEVSAGGAAQQLAVGGTAGLWQTSLSEWLLSLRQELPDVALMTETHTTATLTRRLVTGLLDVAFMLEPPQVEALQLKEVALVQLIMVSSEADITVKEALNGQYLMTDWGIAHSVNHRRAFPDAPESQLRIGQSSIARQHLLDIGGSAYLPARLVADDIATGQLTMVQDAPTFDYTVYGVYAMRSSKTALIKEALHQFDYKVDLDELREYSD